jgi:hypothetical protein
MATPTPKLEVYGHALRQTERLRGRGVGYGINEHVKTIAEGAKMSMRSELALWLAWQR